MDRFNLQRFVDAQEKVYAGVIAELKEGRKRNHWIWFIFPQIAGLGLSQTAKFYSISSLDEAKAYLNHPELGPRLRECTKLINSVPNKSAFEIFASPDDMKFRSSMTLFARATSDNAEFLQALEKYYGGEDQETVVRL
jgi:uncharacterized protein (DUF1810 family)